MGVELPKSEYCAWLQHGEKVNAFPHGCDDWKDTHDGYWTAKGYSKAPLYTAVALTEAVEKAVSQYKADAERYRWLRTADNGDEVVVNGQLLVADKLDAAIDAAIREKS